MALGLDDFQALFDACSNWGRWGADDERGTLNLITPEGRVRAAGLVREGASVSLAHPINTVSDVENIAPAVHCMLRAGDLALAEGATSASTADYLAVAPHGLGHSHLDALCHFIWRGQTYNGRSASEVTSSGARANAITAGQDGIVSRGVLLDIPRLLGIEWLETDHAVSVQELERAEAAGGVRVESGDILLVRTGRHPRRLAQGVWDTRKELAGLHHTVAPWLKARGVALLGSDGVSDVREQPFSVTTHPIHILALVAMGLQLLDNLNLEDIATACQQRARWEFLLTVAPLKLVGGTASMVNPIAVF